MPAVFVTKTVLEVAPPPALPPTLADNAAAGAPGTGSTESDPATAIPPLPPEPPILWARIAGDIEPETTNAPLLVMDTAPDCPPLPPEPPMLLVKLNAPETEPPAARPPLPPLPPKLWATMDEDKGPLALIVFVFVTVTAWAIPPLPPEPAILNPTAAPAPTTAPTE